jgi:nucleoside-diphosphate-sugar epimerase
MISSQLIELLTNGQLHYSGKGEHLVSFMPVENLCSLISLLIEKPASNRSFHCPAFHIPLNSFVSKYSSLTNLPFQINKSPFWLFEGKVNTMQKILSAYSWKGAYFQDSLIRGFLPEYVDAISWEESIKEAVDSLYSTSEIIL